MKKVVLIGNALLLSIAAMAQNSFHFNSLNDNKRQDIGVSSGVLTFGQFVNNCDGKYPENISWEKIYVGIGTPNPTEQFHTTQGVRFEGLTQNDDEKRVLVQDATGKLYWRDAGTIGGGGGNFWSLNGNAITAGQFFGTTNNMDVMFRRNNVWAGLIGDNNTALGTYALPVNTTGYNNTAVGGMSLFSNTTGSSNTGFGKHSLRFNTTGIDNTAVGADAGSNGTTGTRNTAVGASALATNVTGSNNTAIGRAALVNNQGEHNTAVGSTAMLNGGNGSGNTSVGSWSGVNISTGNNNTAIGYNAGAGLASGSGNTIVGANVTGLSGTLSNTIILADGNGTQRLYVDNAGHAGLATTAPSAALHVNCTGIAVSGASNVRFENLQTGAGNVLVIDANGYVMRATATASKSAPSEDVAAIKAELNATRQELAELKAQVQALMGNAPETVPGSTLEIVPTPFSNNAKAVYSIAGFHESASLQILDVNGVLVKSLPITQAKGEVAIGDLNNNGVLFFNIVANGKTIVSKKSVKL